ncbi:MAG: hypothetical protein IJ935_18050 [Afipia sp.]|nr:hypothetical protein [Afipia sp.]
MSRWGHDRDDDTDGKPLKHLVLAEKARQRVKTDPSPRNRPDKENEREKTSETPARSYVEKSATAIKDRIRELVLDDPTLRPDDIAKELKRSHAAPVSNITISNIRAEFRGALKFLKARGLLKRIPE